jgi:hypothetical protein
MKEFRSLIRLSKETVAQKKVDNFQFLSLSIYKNVNLTIGSYKFRWFLPPQNFSLALSPIYWFTLINNQSLFPPCCHFSFSSQINFVHTSDCSLTSVSWCFFDIRFSVWVCLRLLVIIFRLYIFGNNILDTVFFIVCSCSL